VRAAEPEAGPFDAALLAGFAPLTDVASIGLAVSGGADSLALALLAQAWCSGLARPPQLTLFTVDHGLRPESAAEADRVGALAAAWGLPCRILRWSGPYPQADIEAAAREARYRLLLGAAREAGISHLATAHHRDDQAETFLLRLARGSGVYGLAAMPRVADRDGVAIVRPLLGLSHAELVDVVRSAGLRPVEDPHNRDARFARARMRALAPALAREGLTAERLAGTAARLRRAAAAIDIYVGRLLSAAVRVDAQGSVALDAAAWRAEPEETRLRALARMVRAAGGAEQVPRLESLAVIEAAMRADAAPGRLQRTLGGVVLREARGSFWFEREAGRSGLPVVEVERDFDDVWDRRFRIRVMAEDGPVTIRALGQRGRLALGPRPAGISARAIEAAPAIWRGEVLLAAPTLDLAPPAGSKIDVEARSIVAARLDQGTQSESF